MAGPQIGTRPSVVALPARGRNEAAGGDGAALAVLEDLPGWLLAESGVVAPDVGHPVELSREGVVRLGGAVLDVAASYSSGESERTVDTTRRVFQTLIDEGPEAVKRQFSTATESWIASKVAHVGIMLAEARETLGGADVILGMIIRKLTADSTNGQGTNGAEALIQSLFRPAAEKPAAPAANHTDGVAVSNGERPARRRRSDAGRPRTRKAAAGAGTDRKPRQPSAQAAHGGEEISQAEEINESAIEQAFRETAQEYGGDENSHAANQATGGAADEAAEAEGLNLESVRLYLNDIGRLPVLDQEQVDDLCQRIEAGLYAEKILQVSKFMKIGIVPDTSRQYLVNEAYVGLLKRNKKDPGDEPMPTEINEDKMTRAKEMVAELITGVRQHLVRDADGLLALSAVLKSDLTLLAAEGKAAKQKMIERNLKLVVYFAKRKSSSKFEFLDFIQQGNLGLIRAVEKYDYTKGFAFATYASHWIQVFMTRGFEDFGDAIRMPAHIHDTLAKLSKAEDGIQRETGRAAKASEIAAVMGITERRVGELRKLREDALSLDTPLGENEDSTLHDFVADKMPANSSGEDSLLDLSFIEDVINKAQNGLTDKERTILQMAFGLSGSPIYTQKDIALHVNLSPASVRINIIRAFLKLMHPSSPSRQHILQALGVSEGSSDSVLARCRSMSTAEMFPVGKISDLIFNQTCGQCVLKTQCRLEGMALGSIMGNKRNGQQGIWGGAYAAQRVADIEHDPDFLVTAMAVSPLVAAVVKYTGKSIEKEPQLA